jgi:hypothetical protein
MKNKNKYPRFKFVNNKIINNLTFEELLEDFIEVENPLPYNNLPNGTYHIRGNKKDHAKYYFVKDNRWFLTEDKTRDNGHYMCEATTYNLFPSLPEKRYQNLQTVYKCLSPVWKRYVYGYFFWKELRELRRNMKYKRFKIIGR